MVRNSDKTYGQLMQQAREITERQEVGETLQALNTHFKKYIDEWVQQQAEVCMKKGFKLPKYYIWVRLRGEPYANNATHIYPMLRVTRPSPHQDPEHILWSVTNLNEVKFEWNKMSAGMTNYVLANPDKFHEQTVGIAKSIKDDKLEKTDDYLVNGKLI